MSMHAHIVFQFYAWPRGVNVRLSGFVYVCVFFRECLKGREWQKQWVMSYFAKKKKRNSVYHPTQRVSASRLSLIFQTFLAKVDSMKQCCHLSLHWASHTNTDVSARYHSCARTPQCTLYHRLFHWQRHLPSLINIGREKSPDLLLSVESFINRAVAAAVIRHCNTSLKVNMDDCFITLWISLFFSFLDEVL